MKISIIVAMARNRAIGYKGRMPWDIPEDLRHFKQLTTGHTVIMGRKTFESLPGGALPHRRNIVVSRTIQTVEGCEVFSSIETAFDACRQEEEVFVIGGAEIYTQALPHTNYIYMTEVDMIPAAADTYFPTLDTNHWEVKKKEKHEGFSFIEYTRK